jgi:hypothetical protein
MAEPGGDDGAPADAGGPPDLGEDGALAAIEMMSGWINNADGKIGILGAALVVLGGAMVGQRGRVGEIIDHPGARGIVGLVLLGGSAVTLAVAAVNLFLAVWPRLPDPGPSRFSFPYLARVPLAELIDAPPGELRRDAWRQAQTLARVAKAKFQGFARALSAGALAATLFVAWSIVAT